MKDYLILLYYCYTHIEDPIAFSKSHHMYCIENNLLGRIIVANEGINGTISGLKGELLHPTQLYSIIWLFFVGFVLMALWNKQFPPSFILGIYLMLNGIGRFVEEAFRGEVQTVVLKGLRLYQWTAIISIIVGMVFTMIPSNPIVATPAFGWEILIAALVGGFCTCFAMGIDFPQSNARFSRLV